MYCIGIILNHLYGCYGKYHTWNKVLLCHLCTTIFRNIYKVHLLLLSTFTFVIFICIFCAIDFFILLSLLYFFLVCWPHL